MKSTNDLVRHIYKMYKEPVKWWSNAHKEKRYIQIHAAETVLSRCLDHPFAEPRDIIENYMFEICYMRKENDNKNAEKMLKIIEETLEDLLRYLN